MKKRKYKLYNDKKTIDLLSGKDKLISLRVERLFDNAAPSLCAFESVLFNAAAFKFSNQYPNSTLPLLVCSAIAGGMSVFNFIKLNTTERAKERKEEIKKLKQERKALIKKFKTLDEELQKKR